MPIEKLVSICDNKKCVFAFQILLQSFMFALWTGCISFPFLFNQHFQSFCLYLINNKSILKGFVGHKVPRFSYTQVCLHCVTAGEILLTNMRDSIVFTVLQFSLWTTRRTRLNIGKDFNQLLRTYNVIRVKPFSTEEALKKAFPKFYF